MKLLFFAVRLTHEPKAATLRLTGASIGADVYRLIDAGIFVIFGIFSSLVLANDPLQNDHLENRTPVCLLPHRYGQFSVQTPLH